MITRQYFADCEGGFRVGAAIGSGFLLSKENTGLMVPLSITELESIFKAVEEIRAMIQKDQQHDA